MQDRIPLYPGRVKMTPVAGQANTFDMERADDPTQAGTPINKATFLKDATAALYGLGTSAVPDDVLAELGKYKQYWWARKKVSYVEKQTQSTSQVLADGSWPVTITYANSISIDQLTGEISLIDPQTVTLTNGGEENTLLGKYCKTSGVTPEKVLKFPESNVSWEFNTGTPRFIRGTPVYIVTDDEIISNIVEYVRSSTRSAYPDSGVSGGYEYEYLGIPFDNAVTAPKIETGSYVGTGTYGSANPNTLTFGFAPKIVCVFGPTAGSELGNPLTHCAMILTGDAGFRSDSGRIIGYFVVHQITGNTVSWYSTDSQPDSQGNIANNTYNYIAIG